MSSSTVPHGQCWCRTKFIQECRRGIERELSGGCHAEWQGYLDKYSEVQIPVTMF